MMIGKKSWMTLLALLVVSSLLLAGCGAAPEPEVVEKIVEQVVTQVVQETVVVAGTPEVVEKVVEKVVTEVVEVEVETVVTATPEPETGKTVVIGMPSGFDILDPNITTFTRVGRITMPMTDPLIWQVEVGEFVPGLATEWSVSEDATEYTFKLRDDVTFHDGTPFNAEAVKYTFDRIVDPESKSQMGLSLIGPYEETEIINDYEVKVKFSTPYAPFLDSVSEPYLAPVSPTAVESAGFAWGMHKFVGTGPFIFDSMILDNEVVMVRNPDYNWGPPELGFDGPAKVDKLVFKFITEPATRVAALMTGEIDFLDEVLEVDFATLEADPEFTAIQLPQAGMGDALMFNHQQPPTDELAVRKAMQLAMDKQGMIDTVFNGFGTPACALITSTAFGYCDDTCDMAPYDLEAAAAVLEEAGWVDSDGDGIRERDGEKLVVGHYYRADAGNSNEQAAFIKDNMAKIGIEMELNGLSRSGYFDAVRSGQHNTQGWWETSVDPDMMLRGVLHSSNVGGGTNRNNYVDPEMDAMIEAQAAEPDPAKRAELVCDVLKKVKDEAHMEVWLDPMLLYAHDAGLENVVYYLAGAFPYFGAVDISE
ncbi:MAG: ABC transporter substrate-binding protein [Anaerolineae bacterium]